nr:hypothetical protein [uncultured Psychroserpens sp.]
MASGFINITDELCFAPRWSSYDNLLKIIVKHLDSNPLKLIFKAHYPHEDIAEDLDMGWGFIDGKNNTTVARNLNI